MTKEELLKQAIEEAYASAPQDVITLDTLEIHHKSFDTPIRICRWPVVDSTPILFQMKLEELAPVDPGKVVEFIGAPFEIVFPEKSSDTAGTLTIRVDGVEDRLDEYMENAALSGGAISAIYREYIKGQELDGPGSVWAGFELTNPRLEGMTFIIDGAVLNWVQRPFGSIYTALQYPALVVAR